MSQVTFKKPLTSRWKPPVSWDKTRQEKRSKQETTYTNKDGEVVKKRNKNSVLSKRRATHYTQGSGQQGISIPASRARYNIEMCVAESISELENILGATFEDERYFIWTDFVDTIRAALDQYTNVLLEAANEIVTSRNVEFPEDESNDSDNDNDKNAKKKKKQAQKRYKCTAQDLHTAIVMMHHFAH
jgi:hypothetical protein